ncbi:NADH:ubiquinone reductase (Na(+)-transporting) subunit F [Sinimarinibacterium flocculans]|uniref:NADH:ubiquinone reductase (Na(+)-transporting) subunit F n=1 Tax=Sinimarinibacterium flocculans TaxID=985250 RepID=UPI0024928CFD|nr:2Fe-2S iron-sulfur cluster binding domain-containing protein [Sinimarinibacterium flocculans]
MTLQPFGVSFDCAEGETILGAALRNGVSLRYGCKHGNCGSCKAQIAEGEVDLVDASEVALMQFERDQGLALLCAAVPEEDIVIALSDDYTEEELSSAPPIGEYEATVTALKPLTHDIVQLDLNLVQPDFMRFNAGQYVEINAPGTDAWRAFSMANAPGEPDRVVLMIKLIPGGAVSGWLRDGARVGDALRLRGPYGQFGIAPGIAPIIMIAGGSGMAPIVSMLNALAEQKTTRPVTFYFGARAVRDLFLGEEIAELGRRLPDFRYIPALSALEPGDEWDGETGLITEVLQREAGSLRGAEAYLCGPPPMIDAAVEVLKAKGMFSTRIRFDKFVSTAG